MAWFNEESEAPKVREKEREPDGYDVLDFENTALSRVASTDSQFDIIARLARDMTRDIPRITQQAREIGRRLGALLDERGEGTAAFYRWPARNSDGSTTIIQGPTIDLMQELAGAWGGIIFDVHEVARVGQHIKLRARVVDLNRIVASERPYTGWMRPAPKKFQGEELGRWEAMQLQANASKAVRGVLEDIIPSSVTQAALHAAYDSAAEARLGGVSLNEAVTASLGALKAVGIADRDQLVRWTGKPIAEWTAFEVQALRAVWERAKRGELTPDGFRVEAAQREAGRQADLAEETGHVASADPLADVGLGAPAARAAQAAGNRDPDPTPVPPPPSPQPAAPGGSPSSASGGGQAGQDDPAPAAEAAPANPEQDARALARVLTGRTDTVELQMVAGSWREALKLQQLRRVRVAAAVRWGQQNGLWEADWDPAGNAISVKLTDPGTRPLPTTGPSPVTAADHRSPERRDLEASIADLERDLGPEAVQDARSSVNLGVRMPLADCSTELLQRYRDALDAAIPEPGANDGDDDGGEG